MKIDAKAFDALARTVFAPVYPVIARQIIEHTSVIRGTCLDIGCGGGYLGAALARATHLFVHFFDASGEMLDIVRRTIAENGLEKRADVLQGDVSAIPLPDNGVDLAVSRGSVFFWEDRVRAFREIYRVLAPDGWAYIGGGFGSAELREEIARQMKERNRGNDQWREKMERNLGYKTRSELEEDLKAAGIGDVSIRHHDDFGLWVVMRKSNPDGK